MAAHIPVTVRHKQSVLELADVQERLEYLLGMMESEADILQVEKRIRGRVKKQMEKSQRNYYLSEQIKAIRKEGYREGDWILMDFGDVIVHIFTDEERQHYDFDSLWKDAPSEDYSQNKNDK